MRRTAAVLDPANTCSHCPHELVRLRTGTLWCPCEDCHAGGLIQGREPKDNHTVAPSYGPSSEVDDLTSETNDPDVWVDPIHQL
jgi:uncharacterized Zn finger protein (UPF0148 family)